MKAHSFLRDIAERISQILPKNMDTLKSDCEKNIHSILLRAFSKLDLVTREEFDTQTKVLARTRQKVEALETQLSAIEAAINKRADI